MKTPRRGIGGRPKRSEVKAREERLLDIATEAFLRDGLATTIEGIAAAAGVSKRTIYARYPDKRSLFAAAVARLISTRTRETFALDPSLPLREMLTRFARVSFETSFRPEIMKLNKLARREGEQFPELVDVMLKESEVDLVAPFAAYLDQLKARGTIRDIDAAAVARLFLNGIYGEVNRYHFRGLPKPPQRTIESWVETLADIYVQALRT